MDSELQLILRAAVIYWSVVQSGSTFGQDLLSVRYKNLSSTKKVLYFLSAFSSYLKAKLELFNLGRGLNDLLFRIDVFYKIFNLLNVTWFLQNGKKPQLIERLLGLEHVYAHEGAQRRFDSKYLGRELLWNGFIVSKKVFVLK